MFLNKDSKFRCLTSLPRLLRVIKFADFNGTIKALRLPTIHLAALRSPSLGDTLVVVMVLNAASSHTRDDRNW